MACGEQLRVVDDVVSVVDPLTPQQLDAVANVLGGPDLTRVRRPVQTQLGGEAECVHEVRGRVAVLVEVEADPDDTGPAVVLDHLHEFDRSVSTELAVDGRNEVAEETEVGLGFLDALHHTVEHRRVLDADLEVRVRAEEELDVPSSPFDAPLEALVCHPPEVVAIADGMGDERIHEQEVGKRVVAVQVGHLIMRRQIDPVLRRQLGERVDVHRALEVQVQLGLRHRP